MVRWKIRLLFFFSSRRRHTRLQGDWSSDVCSSDLWDAAVNPQAEYNKSFTAGIAALSGGKTDADSWDKIFRWFNHVHGRADTGYQAGDMIAIKINQNNSAAPAADRSEE